MKTSASRSFTAALLAFAYLSVEARSATLASGSTFPARDTLDCGIESVSDASACLDGLKWICQPFDVQCQAASEGFGDWLMRFPTPHFRRIRQRLPCIVPVLLPLLALIAAGVWRFAPASAGWTASGLTLVLALVSAWRFPRAARSSLPALAVLAVLITGLRLIPGDVVWQCAVHCQGGGHYQKLFGLNVLWPALISYALFAALCLRDQHAERLSRPATAR